MARRRGPRMPKEPKPKRATYTLVDRESQEGKPYYAMLDDLVERHHHELINARIAIAWNHTWKPDADGRCKLGHLKKASDLDRELAPLDFVVLLRGEFMTDPTVTDDKRRALIDHELCHGTVKLDSTGEPAVDTKGRTVYRMRKHDIEEFAAVVERHGTYKRDLEAFAAALRRSKQGRLFADKEVLAAVAKKVEGEATATATSAPLPGEPHVFRPKAPGMLECEVCGSTGLDPVHVVQTSVKVEPPPKAPHAPGNSRDRAHASAKRRGPLARAGRRKGKEARA